MCSSATSLRCVSKGDLPWILVLYLHPSRVCNSSASQAFRLNLECCVHRWNQNQQSRHRFEITTGCSKFRFSCFFQKELLQLFFSESGHSNLSLGAVLVGSRPNALIVFFKAFCPASAVRQMPNEKLAHGAHGDLQHMDWTKSLRPSLWEIQISIIFHSVFPQKMWNELNLESNVGACTIADCSNNCYFETVSAHIAAKEIDNMPSLQWCGDYVGCFLGSISLLLLHAFVGPSNLAVWCKGGAWKKRSCTSARKTVKCTATGSVQDVEYRTDALYVLYIYSRHVSAAYYTILQVEPGEAGWRKFPGLRIDPKTSFAYRSCGRLPSSSRSFWALVSDFGTVLPLSFHLFLLISTPSTRADSLHLSCTCPISSQPTRSEQDSRTLSAEYLTARSRLCRFETNIPLKSLKHASMTMSRPAELFPAEYPTLLSKQTCWIKKQIEVDECCKIKNKTCRTNLATSTNLATNTSYYKARTKYFPVRLRTTMLAQNTSQYYFVLQSLHKLLPGTTSYYKACTKHFPVLLRTTKLAQSTSQYYFVLQSLHKVLPGTTSYYKACTKYFPVLLRTTKLAQSTSQDYFVLQSLHKMFPSTT